MKSRIPSIIVYEATASKAGKPNIFQGVYVNKSLGRKVWTVKIKAKRQPIPTELL